MCLNVQFLSLEKMVLGQFVSEFFGFVGCPGFGVPERQHQLPLGTATEIFMQMYSIIFKNICFRIIFLDDLICCK